MCSAVFVQRSRLHFASILELKFVPLKLSLTKGNANNSKEGAESGFQDLRYVLKPKAP